MSDAPTDRRDACDTADAVTLPHERLEVYRVALELNRALLALLPKRGRHELRSQAERAATSIVLNIAEGAGRFQANDKRRFFEIAKGSATEVAAVVDLLHTCGHASAPSRQAVRSLAVRVVQMLSRLAATLT